MDILKKPEEYAKNIADAGFKRTDFLANWKAGNMAVGVPANYILDVLDAMKKIEEDKKKENDRTIREGDVIVRYTNEPGEVHVRDLQLALAWVVQLGRDVSGDSFKARCHILKCVLKAYQIGGVDELVREYGGAPNVMNTFG